ncbi:MAG: glycoside hydrolase family 32 protein [Anaerolineae bacterium]
MSNAVDYRRKRVDDPLRPSFHFTAPQNWLNDPNGLVYWRGQYHLFYQHNPYAPQWGAMHWGHAVSSDLVHWQDLPIALAPTAQSADEQGVWSGCLVDDGGVATIIYTGVQGDQHQHQTVCIATSTDDDLCDWHKYPDNPLQLAMPPHLTGAGFRDPYVWRQDGLWKMVVGSGALGGADVILLYEGETLYEWQYVDVLVSNDAQNDFIYECPNFFPLGDKWVLLVSVMPTSHVEYFVGLFWNNHFIVETHGTLGNHPFYAPLTFEDPSGRRLMIGWLQETRQADDTQAEHWAGTMSVPMELMLLENNQLAVTPAREILDHQLARAYRQFHDVHAHDLAEIQASLPSKRLKVVASDDLSKVIFIDGSVIEVFDFPEYAVRRYYQAEADLTDLVDWLRLPQKRIGIWVMPDTL